jgi:2-octaprenylphenol hydroxylase
MTSENQVNNSSAGVTDMVDIAIVGGGMAGTALACALANTDYRIALIESHASTPFSTDHFFDSRVVALSAASRQFLQQVGAWEEIAAKRISPFERMQVWDAEGTAEVVFDCHDAQQSTLGHIVENSLVVSALQHCLQKQHLPNTDLDKPHTDTTVTQKMIWHCPDTVTHLTHNEKKYAACELTLQSGKRIHAKLVVAADGAVSGMRQLAGLQTTEWDYGHTAVIATVRTSKPHQRTARQRFQTSGPVAFLPLSNAADDQDWCSVVWSTSHEAAQQLLALSDNAFATALGEAFEHRLGDILAVHGRSGFALRQRHATSYHHEHVVLIGDAAHTIHPLAGQGINLGLMDVQVLAEELLAAQQRGLSPCHHSVLARYQRRRRGANLTMTATMELFHRLFARQELPFRWLRNMGMRSVDRLPALKRELMRQAMGI